MSSVLPASPTCVPEGKLDDAPMSAGAPHADPWGLSALRATHVVALPVAGVVDPGEDRAIHRRAAIVLAPRLR